MLRHSVLYLYRDSASDEERSSLLRGLAYLGMEFASVRAGDYGDDIAGGSQRLLEVPPWTRPPRFRARGQGPPSNFDVALHLDFDDDQGLAAFEAADAQQAVARLNAAVTVDELTARVDWRHDGNVPNRRGRIRHCAMHVWRDDVDPETRARVSDAVAALTAMPGVESVAFGESARTRPSDYDWLLDVQFADTGTARTVLGGDPFTELTDLIAEATKDEWTARVTHVMRGER
jgi:hypothetical protein